jgi:hypothetical protein
LDAASTVSAHTNCESRSRTLGRFIIRAVTLIAVGSLLLSWAALAATPLDQVVEFHIAPMQSLESGLLEFAEQAQIPVSISAASLSGHTCPGVNGKLPAIKALEAILRDSGFGYRQVGDTVAVLPLSAIEQAERPRRENVNNSVKPKR